MFNDAQARVIDFCAEECRRQLSGETSVANMLRAWDHAARFSAAGFRVPTFADIIILGQTVEPLKNLNGFRQVTIQVGSEIIGWQNIHRQTMNLANAAAEIEPQEFFVEFELVHPFIDGNGRVGQILFNWLRSTLENPTYAEFDLTTKFHQEG